MPYKILVTGSNGQLGSEIKELAAESKNTFLFTDVNELDITNMNELHSYLKNKKTDLVINCAAYTAVDKAEKDEETAYKINTLAVKNLALLSSEFNYRIIHISTDFVFDGTKSIPYVETDPTNPLSVYGRTKLEGEKELLNNTDKGLIIRTSWLYSAYGNNFVKTMMRLGCEKTNLNVIFDQAGTPTYAKDLAESILHIISDTDNRKNGIYHYSNEGVASWYDFASAVMKYAGLNCKVLPIETKDYPTPAKRPSYSVMNKAKIKRDYDLTIPNWQDSLVSCINKLGIK